MHENPRRAPQARNSGRCEHDPADPAPSWPRARASPNGSHLGRVPASAGVGSTGLRLVHDRDCVPEDPPRPVLHRTLDQAGPSRSTTSRPDSAWVTQRARNLAFTECLEDKHILLRDRDSKFCGPFDEVFRTEGLNVVRTPVQARRRTLSRSVGSAVLEETSSTTSSSSAAATYSTSSLCTWITTWAIDDLLYAGGYAAFSPTRNSFQFFMTRKNASLEAEGSAASTSRSTPIRAGARSTG